MNDDRRKHVVWIQKGEKLEEHTTASAQETMAIAKQFAKTLHGGEVLALSGDLGAGKTTFVKGLALGLGITSPITSPTFVLMKVYVACISLCHIDCYRLSSQEDLLAIGADEYMGKQGVVTALEWSRRVKGLLPKDAIEISLEIL